MHRDFVNKPFGSQITSKNGSGFMYALRVDPHLFTISLVHMTQILYQADISMVLHLLDLKQGDLVFESGTGSCSLTFSLSKRVGNPGKVYTFEFNEDRYKNSQKVIEQMGIHNVKCHWQNVLENGFITNEFLTHCSEDHQQKLRTNSEIVPVEELQGIRFLAIADAVFLDLPSPERVILQANKILKTGGRLCSFSPCIEQIQETAKILAKFGYLDMQTVEIIEREMNSKKVTDENLLLEADQRDPKRGDSGLFVDNNDQKMHTGYLIFATKYRD